MKILSIFLFLIAVIPLTTTIITVYAEPVYYEDYDGKILTKDEYEKRVELCNEMQDEEGLDPNINCKDWVVTYKGALELVKKGIRILVD